MDEPRETGWPKVESMNWVRELYVTHRMVPGGSESTETLKVYGPTRESLLLPCEIAMDAALRRVAADAVVPGACE